MLSKSLYKQHYIVYLILLIFWAVFQLFTANAFEMGWGFIPLVISLPFVPFILVWLGVQFVRHYRYLKDGINRLEHMMHCACTSFLFSLFVFHFVH
ncbi:hypothetical protein [Shewanella colwelliana]|uniref:Uncharacterized protein n=2 Tax=Shewanella colwelliana TaxID=23 RepID=A0A1E5INQ0_SHECO|nr:hypothetical protein [Shewanella colwelliana]MDX1280284.1 hypothetical protein [Shewanella colwelliana]OEG72162.1 hypothetical protein BEL05_04000 [Shewanella colwelliana]